MPAATSAGRSGFIHLKKNKQKQTTFLIKPLRHEGQCLLENGCLNSQVCLDEKEEEKK